jgi:hypothetical protein
MYGNATTFHTRYSADGAMSSRERCEKESPEILVAEVVFGQNPTVEVRSFGAVKHFIEY